MNKKITKKPLIHENCNLINSELGIYTEVGIYNYLENVRLGDFSYTGQFCILQNAEIGKFSNIAAMVRVGPTDHPLDRPTLHHFTYRKVMYAIDSDDDEEFFANRARRKVYIGHDTWIGHGAIIMPEIKIGNGAVVGSGAVVTKNVAPYTIVVGVPAKTIKLRFEEDITVKLDAIRWWDWSYSIIKERVADFSLPIDQFVAKYHQGG